MPVHIIQRGNNRQAIFHKEKDYYAYLAWLGQGAEKYDCAIHGYALMSNHVHLLATPGHANSISKMIQFTGRQYVPYFNRSYERTGTLWEGRYKSSVIDAESYYLACLHYIEMNPVRAGVVRHPRDYRWSSYCCNAEGEPNSLITPHSMYTQLGDTPAARQKVYSKWFSTYQGLESLADIRTAWHSGTPLGEDLFCKHIEWVVDHKIGQSRRGRPKRALTPFSETSTPKKGL